VDKGNLSENFKQSRYDAGAFDRKPQHLSDLPKKDADGDAIEKPDQDGFGQKIRQRTEAEVTCRDAEQAGQQSQRSRERKIKFRTVAGERRDSGGDHCAGRRIGIDHQLP
jgi:hypothetical protein